MLDSQQKRSQAPNNSRTAEKAVLQATEIPVGSCATDEDCNAQFGAVQFPLASGEVCAVAPDSPCMSGACLFSALRNAAYSFVKGTICGSCLSFETFGCMSCRHRGGSRTTLQHPAQEHVSGLQELHSNAFGSQPQSTLFIGAIFPFRM